MLWSTKVLGFEKRAQKQNLKSRILFFFAELPFKKNMVYPTLPYINASLKND
jgi:hypothetical protein